MATKAIYDIKQLQKLSLGTAMTLFRTKITPIMTYRLTITWTYLTTRNLRNLEAVKARFLKAALGLSTNMPSRLVYKFARETFLIEDLRIARMLPSSKQADELLAERRRKRDEIWEDFFSTDTMVDRNWTGPNQELRSELTRLAMHGFHHKMCMKSGYHEHTENCVCSLCGKSCDRYYFTWCSNRTKSLREYSKEYPLRPMHIRALSPLYT